MSDDEEERMSKGCPLSEGEKKEIRESTKRWMREKTNRVTLNVAVGTLGLKLLSLTKKGHGCIVAGMTDKGELVKYKDKLVGGVLVAIEGQEVSTLSLSVVAETLRSMWKVPKILTFLVPDVKPFFENEEEKENMTNLKDAKDYKIVKNGESGFICPDCLRRFEKSDSLITHVVTSHVKDTSQHSSRRNWTDMMRSTFSDGLVLPESFYKGSVTALRAALRAIPLPEPSDSKSVSQLVGQLKRLTSTFGVPKIALPKGVRITKIILGHTGIEAEMYQTNSIAALSTSTSICTDERVRTVLYFHGGGYAACSVATHRHFLANLCSKQIQVVAVSYRKPPAHKYPAAVSDAVRAYRFLLNQYGKSGGLSSNRVVFGGDSAGGGLCLSAMIAIKEMRFAPLPSACFLLSPWVDLTDYSQPSWNNSVSSDFLNREICEVFARCYAGDHSVRAPGVSPIFGDLSGLPPLLMEVGSGECFLDQCKRFASKARRAGVAVAFEPVDSMAHCFTLWVNFFSKSKMSFRRVYEFVDLNCPKR